MIINDKIFDYYDKIFTLKDPANYPGYVSEEEDNYYSEDDLPKSSDLNEAHYDELYKNISSVHNKLDSEIFEKYFKKKSLLKLFKYLKPSYNKVIDSARETVIKTDLADLKKDIRNMSDDEVKSKNLDLISYLVEKVLDTIKKIDNQE